MHFRHTITAGGATNEGAMLINSKSYFLRQGAAFLLLLAIAACGGSSSGVLTPPPPAAPTVMSNTPANGASGVPINGNVSASFSEAMDPATLTPSTFTLTSGAAEVPVQGTVAYANSTAIFWPATHLASDSTFIATITTGAKSASGVALAAKRAWSITTGAAVASQLPVDLGTAGNFVILAKSGISTVPTSAATGDIGVSPIAATAITGFSLVLDPSGVFSTSSQVTRKVYAASYAAPTPANLTTAVSAMEAAFTDAAGRTPDFTEFNSGNIGGQNLVPGVYKWSTGLLIPTNVTLTGSATDVWIFQIAQNLTMGSAANVLLAGGVLPKNVFWQVSGLVDLGTTAHFEGVILCQTGITLHAGAVINGRLLAQTAVALDSSTVTESLAPPATAVTLTPSPILPVTAGTAVVFTAVGSGSAGTPAAGYQYQFWKRGPGENLWTMVQDYGVGSTYTLPGSAPPGTYGVGVDVRTSLNVLWDTYTAINFFDLLAVPIQNPAPRMSGTASPKTYQNFLGSADVR